MAELGQILLNLINVIAAGVVVFFPSYTFLRSAKSVWEKAGSLEKFLMKREVCLLYSACFRVDKIEFRCSLSLMNQLMWSECSRNMVLQL